MSGIRAITIRKKKKNSRNMKPDEEQIKAIFNKVLNNQTLDKVLSLVGIEDCCESTFKSMTEEDTVKLFVNTLPTLKGERPGRNEAWLLRITASRIYAIYTCTKKTNTCWKQKSTKFFWPKTFTNQYVRHGIENQKLATETYESKEKVKVVQCGFIVHPKHQWTGVSPDGLVFGESGPEKLIEIKCLFAGKQKSINECLSSCEYLEKKNDKCDIKKKHPCYGQIQLGMLLCNVKECDFILFASFDQSIKVISVPFDEEFALEMFTVVRDTYFNKMLEYICRHKKRHQDQREGASSMAKKPMIRYEDENEKLKDKSRCAGIRADLKMCLLESDCCKIHKRTPRECLNSSDGTVPSECQALRRTFFDCKHSLIDGRRRFRGPKGY